MGMAASQARLLSITARIHDVEYQAQSIQSAKMDLTRQSDEVQREYEDALDAQTLTVATINPETGVTTTIAATFNNMFSKRRAISATQKDYMLKDRNGNVVVENSVWEKYQDFLDSGLTDNPYMFAMYMLGQDTEIDWEDFGTAENAFVVQGNIDDTLEANIKKLFNQIVEMLGSDPDEPGAVYDSNDFYTNATDEEQDLYEKKLSEYQKLLYSKHGAEIYASMYSEPEENFDQADFNYYVKLYKAISASGGCVSIEDFNGLNGDAKNDSEWLRNMVQSGLMTISTMTEDAEGTIKVNGVTIGADENVGYTSTSKIDSTALAKAEARYEHAMKQIDRQDKKFDLDLSKLETERNALKTEYDSIKKVIEDNIDRTFGIFS